MALALGPATQAEDIWPPPQTFSWGSSPLGAVQEERDLVGALEERALVGALEERALEGALEERAL